jgi:hypothetical protein
VLVKRILLTPSVLVKVYVPFNVPFLLFPDISRITLPLVYDLVLDGSKQNSNPSVTIFGE